MEHTQIVPAGMASFGIDIGHSSVKLSVAMLDNPALHHSATIPTSVMPALKISHEETARRAIINTVTLNGSSHFFGQTAIDQGSPAGFSGEDRDWIKTVTHDVLAIGAWQHAMSMINCHPRVIHLALGLPTGLFSTQKNVLRDRITGLLQGYLAPGQTLKIMIQQQSSVPLKNIQHLPNGLPDPKYDLGAQSWAVIDVGHFSTDFSVLLKTEFQEIGGDSITGAMKVYSAMRSEFKARGWTDTLESVDEALKTGGVLHWPGRIDVTDIIDTAVQPLREAIINRAQALFGSTSGRLNGIIVSGGIAPLVFDSIQAVFPNAVLDPIPTMSVAEGLCRGGLFAHHMLADTYRA